MPYPYTYGSPYLAQLPQNAVTLPYQQQPVQQFQQSWNAVKVDGGTEAMNRFLMHYPASMLVPSFISDPLFDIDGRHFYTLSIEMDGRRNLERFKYTPDPEGQSFKVDNVEFVSRKEFDEFTAKVDAAIGALNGVHATVPADRQPAGGYDARPNQYAQESGGWQPAGVGGATGQVQRDMQAPQRYDDASLSGSTANSGEVTRRGL